MASTKIEALRDISATLGLVRDIEEEPAGHDCFTHEVPLVARRVETINGWVAVIVCPEFNGDCANDPNAAPMNIEAPKADKPTSPIKAKGNGSF